MIFLSAALIYLLYDGDGVRSNTLVDYLAVAVTVSLVIIILTLIIINKVVRKLIGKIIITLDEMSSSGAGVSGYDELMQYAVNIDQEKKSLRVKIEELSNRVETAEIITGSMQEGLILTDKNGLILSANSSTYRIFGENIERKNVSHVCREGFFQRAVKQCLAGESDEIRMRLNDKIYSVFFSPVFSNGSVESIRGSVILFHDTTERYKAEQQRREFSANVSHELKTPLTTISAISEMIAQGMTKEEDIRTFAGRITEQSGRLLLLIDDIIRLSEFDEGNTSAEDMSFDLHELAESVIAALSDNAKAVGVEVELKGERFDVFANSRMIDELLYNLIDNGIKYNHENGKVTVELTKDKGTVPLSSSDDAGDVNKACYIIVSDTGIGIAKEHHTHIFERFYRADKSRSKKTGGTGLGLSIVKHITEYYNGSLELNSKPGVGTTIKCLLKI